jgi:DNA-binding transcriptional MerR regulator
LRRIAFIVFAQKIGLSLDEIGQELARLPDDHVPTGRDGSRLSKKWEARIDERMAELQRLKAGLTECIGCGCLWSDDESPSFGKLAFRAVRTPTHKLILWKDPARGEELYDLAADPAETHNRAADPAARTVLDDLRTRLLAWMQKTSDPALSWPRASNSAAGAASE